MCHLVVLLSIASTPNLVRLHRWVGTTPYTRSTSIAGTSFWHWTIRYLARLLSSPLIPCGDYACIEPGAETMHVISSAMSCPICIYIAIGPSHYVRSTSCCTCIHRSLHHFHPLIRTPLPIARSPPPCFIDRACMSSPRWPCTLSSPCSFTTLRGTLYTHVYAYIYMHTNVHKCM